MEGYFKNKEHESKLKTYFNLDWTVRLLPFGSTSFFNKDKTENDEVIFEEDAISEI